MGTILIQIAKAVLAAKAQGKLVGLLGSKTAGGVALTAGATELWAPLAAWVLGRLGLPITSAEGVHVVELVFQAGGGVLALYGYLHARRREKGA
jgi:hypothetical protein